MMFNVIGLFSEAKNASGAINALAALHLSEQNISLVTNENMHKDQFAIDDNTKLSEGAAIGAIGGGVLGAVVGGLAAAGTVATGGVGLLASGPIVAALTSGAFSAGGGAMLGSVFGVLVPESENQQLVDAVERGAIAVLVECPSKQICEVKKLLAQWGADKVHSNG